MSITQKIRNQLPQAISAIRAAQEALKKPGISPFDVRTIQLIPNQDTTAKSLAKIIINRMVNFPKMAESAEELVEGLKKVEKGYGTVAAFTLGALIAAGITNSKELVQNAIKLDLLFDIIKSRVPSLWYLSDKGKIGKIREELWKLAPYRFAGFDIGDNFQLDKILDKYLQAPQMPIGDCVSLTLIDNLIFMKYGFAMGVRAYFNHVCSTTKGLTFDNTINNFSEAVRLHAEAQVKATNLNYLGFIALLYNCRGNYLSYQGKMEEAQKAYDMAVNLLPDHATIYNNRANHKCLTKDYAGAEADYQRSIDLEQNPYFYIGRAVMYLEKGETEKAVQDIKKAYELDPKNPDYQELFTRLGLAQLHAGIIPRLIVTP